MTLPVLAREATQLDSSLHNREGTLRFYSSCKKEKEYIIKFGGFYFVSIYIQEVTSSLSKGQSRA